MYGKARIVTEYESVKSQFEFCHTLFSVVCVSLAQQTLNSIVTLKFSIHIFFKTRVLLKIFDIQFPFPNALIPSHFGRSELFCLLAKMASETVIRPIALQGKVDKENRPKSQSPGGP